MNAKDERKGNEKNQAPKVGGDMFPAGKPKQVGGMIRVHATNKEMPTKVPGNASGATRTGGGSSMVKKGKAVVINASKAPGKPGQMTIKSRPVVKHDIGKALFKDPSGPFNYEGKRTGSK